MNFEEFLKHVRNNGNPIPEKAAHEGVIPTLLYPAVNLTVKHSYEEGGLVAGKTYRAVAFCGPRGTYNIGVLLQGNDNYWIPFSEVSVV
jgi:hypothetical protein